MNDSDVRFWWHDAACRTADPDIFFPDTYTKATIAIAKQYCDRCPVIDDCLDVHGTEEFGIWAGTAPNDRIPVDDEPPDVAPCCGAPLEIEPSSKYIHRHKKGFMGYPKSEPCRWARLAHSQQTIINKQRTLFGKGTGQ